MADLIGTPIGAPVVPTADTDTYPSHIDTYGKGGFRPTSDKIDRNAIPVQRLAHGMYVYCRFEGELYVLKDTWDGVSLTVDSDWQLVARNLGFNEVWIDTAGNDSNAGTAASPFLTKQHAIDVLAPMLSSASSLCVINVNTGVYVGDAGVFPENAAGYCAIIGDGGVCAFSGSTSPGVKIQSHLTVFTEGVSFTDYLIPFDVEHGALILGNNTQTGSSVFTRAAHVKHGKLIVADGAAVTLQTTDSGTSSAIFAEDSYIGVYGTLTTQDAIVPFFGVDSTLDVKGSITHTASLAGSTRFIQWYGGSVRLGGDITCDGVTSDASSKAIELENGCKLLFNTDFPLFGSPPTITVTMQGYESGWYFGQNVTVVENNFSNTFVYGMAANRIVAVPSAMIFTQSLLNALSFLGAIPTSFVRLSDSVNTGATDTGFDYRFLQDLAESSFEYEVTSNLASTPVTLLTGAASKVTWCDTIQVTNITGGAIVVSIYHSDSGAAAANGNMLVTTSVPAESTLKLSDIPVTAGGKIYVESDTLNSITAKAWGYTRSTTLADTPTLLAQSSPGAAAQTALMNPANGHKVFIDKAYVANRNAASQTVSVWCDQDGNTYNDTTLVVNEEAVFKAQLNIIELGVWMNDNSGFLAWQPSVGSDLTMTVYGREWRGA